MLSALRTEYPERQQTQGRRQDEPVGCPEVGRSHGPELLEPRYQPLRQRLTPHRQQMSGSTVDTMTSHREGSAAPLHAVRQPMAPGKQLDMCTMTIHAHP